MNGLRASFVEQGDQVCITFFDPCYVRSDAIVIDEDDSVHAILHEASHYIGKMSEDMAARFKVREEVLLAATHANGHMLNLKAKLLRA